MRELGASVMDACLRELCDSAAAPSRLKGMPVPLRTDGVLDCALAGVLLVDLGIAGSWVVGPSPLTDPGITVELTPEAGEVLRRALAAEPGGGAGLSLS